MINSFINAAEEMLGAELGSKWKVIERIKKNPAEDSGGWFSISYIVESLDKEKKRAFLKALDYKEAFKSPNLVDKINQMTAAFIFERNVLNTCKEKRLRRIITSIDYGDFNVQNSPYPTQYLIFELADGNIRKYMKISKRLDTIWILKTIHQTAAGIQQLHLNGIAHQDIKPSNILTFNSNITKICDLGRSSVKGENCPTDMFVIPGDKTYAPPEFLYFAIPDDWNTKKYGYDLYTLGNLIVFLFSKGNVTASIFERLSSDLHFNNWTGTYDEILPYINNAFNEFLISFSNDLPSDLRVEIVELVRQLCNPDPYKRGYPKNLNSKHRQFSLEQYISKLDIMIKKVEYGFWRTNR
ncbi:MAG: protein kinase [Clostridia bacterium]